MQGVFTTHRADHANWGEVLNPDVDEETQQQIRENAANRRAQERLARARGGVGGPAPDPPPVEIPTAPPVRFTTRGVVFFVLNKEGVRGIEPRPGIWGHYLVSFVEDQTSRTAKPFKENADNAVDLVHQKGFPGSPLEGGSDGQPRPDTKKCKEGRDFVRATDTPAYWEVGADYLRKVLEEAEAKDLAFARKMEGLGSVTRTSVWDCLDPDYDPSDREAVMNQFMSKYLERFYSRQDTGNTPGVAKVSEEALHKHKTFCKAWAQKHYKTLTPAVTAPAETLAADFFQAVTGAMPGVTRPGEWTPLVLARVFMRHETSATEFAQALHFFCASLEQTRGARNASYRQMHQTELARVASYKRFGIFLESHWHLLARELVGGMTGNNQQGYLQPLTVDWYDILGQMPEIHRYFEEIPLSKGVSARMGEADAGVIPPWLFSRDG